MTGGVYTLQVSGSLVGFAVSGLSEAGECLHGHGWWNPGSVCTVMVGRIRVVSARSWLVESG